MIAYIVHGIFKPSVAAVQHSAGWSIPTPEQSEVSEQAIPILHVENVARAMTPVSTAGISTGVGPSI
jgi:hypothetical protein